MWRVSLERPISVIVSPASMTPRMLVIVFAICKSADMGEPLVRACKVKYNASSTESEVVYFHTELGRQFAEQWGQVLEANSVT